MSGTQCHAQVTNQMSYTIYSSRCLIKEFQTGLREDPESMLYVLLVLMYTLSLIFLSFHLFDLSKDLVHHTLVHLLLWSLHSCE